MTARYSGGCWLVYGLPGSWAGVRLVIDEAQAQAYADEGFEVQYVFETERMETTAVKDARRAEYERKVADGTWKHPTCASFQNTDPVPGAKAEVSFLFAELALRGLSGDAV
jgi:hypothetical protein